MKLYDHIRDGKTYIIAEMSGNHGGKLENALAIVRAAAAAGADCLKLQTYTADTITLNCRTDDFLVHDGLWKKRYLYDLYKEAYTPWEWHAAIKREAESLGMDFLSTPFDFTAVDFLETLGVELYKIASFEAVDIPLIRKAASTGKPVILSCGMASAEEIQEALDACRSVGNDHVVLLKCCSAYPTDFDTMNLRTIPDMRSRFGVPVGLSDHSEGSLASIAAVTLGAVVVEKHLCLASCQSVDSDFSLNETQFAQLVRDIRSTERALGKANYAPSPAEAQSLAHRRSLYVAADIRKGEPFTAENLRSVRPAFGLHTRYYDELLEHGRAAKDLAFGTPLHWEDVDGVEPH